MASALVESGLRITTTPVAPEYAIDLVKIEDRFGVVTSWTLATGREDLVAQAAAVHRRISWGRTARN